MKRSSPFKEIECIYVASYPMLFQYIWRLCQNRQLTEDIIQETFIRLLKNPDSVQQVQHLHSWLRTISKRLLFDHYKKKKPTLLTEEQLLLEIVLSPLNVEKLYEQKEQLRHVLNSLSKQDQLLILLKFHYGYSYEELTDLLNTPIETLKKRMYRFRKSLYRKENHLD